MIDVFFGGSGTNFPVYVGAWEAILKARKGHPIARIGGTSGGAIVAAAVATGMSPFAAMEIARKYLIDDVLLDKAWFGMWRGKGIHKGKRLHKLLRDTFPGTMAETRIPLFVWAVDHTTGKEVLFSSANTPDMLVADALRASASIPIFFQPFKCWVDGGMVANLGADIFDDDPRETIAVKAVSEGDFEALDYPHRLAAIMMKNGDKLHMPRKAAARTIFVPVNQSGTDFAKSRQQIDDLNATGFTQTFKALDTSFGLGK